MAIVAIDDIRVSDRRRAADPEKVAALAGSIHRSGLLQPVVVSDDLRLIAGLHRLEACRLLGWATLEAKVLPVTGAAAELAEIDENLMRAELTVLEQAEHLARRNELLEEMDMRAPSNRPPQKGDNMTPLQTTASIAADMGFDERSAQRRLQIAREIDPEVKAAVAGTALADNLTGLLALARMSPDEQREIVAVEGVADGRKTVKQARRETAARARSAAPPLPDGKYDVIYADPPWPYEDHGVTVDPGYGGTRWHYPSMTVDEICALPIGELAAGDCALFIWVTSPKLDQVWPVIAAWGFEYKTSFIWDKVKHNYGYYNSVRHELLLVAGRGRSTPEVARLFDSVQVVERVGHSEKPEVFREIIETLYPSARKIELFARRPAAGWDTWGDAEGVSGAAG